MEQHPKPKNAPFSVGDKVAIKIDEPNYGIKKGDTFTVREVTQECHTWLIDVGLIYLGEPVTCSCIFCGKQLYFRYGQKLPIEWYLLELIDVVGYENITSQLAVLPVDEVPDIKHIKELI